MTAETFADSAAAIAKVLGVYFDGLYYSDTVRLAQVMHPRAQYVCVTDGSLLYRTMEEYFAIVDERPSPASRNDARTDRIISIELAGPVTAFARGVRHRAEAFRRSPDADLHRRAMADHLQGVSL